MNPSRVLKIKLTTQLLTTITLCGLIASAFSFSIATQPNPYGNPKPFSTNNSQRFYLPRRGKTMRCFVTADFCIFEEQFPDDNTSHGFVGLGSGNIKALLQSEIAAKFATVGDYRRAIIIARAIIAPLPKVAALTQIAAQYGKARQVNQARQTLFEAEQTARNKNDVKAIVPIAVQYAALGQNQTAARIFEEVLKLQSSKESIDAAEIGNVTVITTGLLASGQTFEAEQMVRHILRDDQRKRNMRYWLVKCPLYLTSYPVSNSPKDSDHSFDQCQKTIVPRAPDTPIYYDLLMEPLLEAQKTDLAILVIKEEITNSEDRNYTLYQVCQMLALSGEVEQALQILQTIPSNKFSQFTISRDGRASIEFFRSGVPDSVAKQKSSLDAANYAIQLAEERNFKDALLTSRTIFIPYHKTLTLTAIAIKLMEVKQLDLAKQTLSQAIQIGKTLGDSYTDFGKQQGLGAIAVMLAEANQFSQSFKVVDTIESKPYKIAVSIVIADTYLQLGKISEASKLLSAAFEETKLLR